MTKAKNLMSSTWTKAAMVRRSFKAGRQRQKDLDYTVDHAIHEACILLIEIRKEMLLAGIRTANEDLRALFILVSDSKGGPLVDYEPMPTNFNALPEFAAKVLAKEKAERARPLGVAIEMRDREAKDKSIWVHSWLAYSDVVEEAEAKAESAFEGLSG